MSERRRWKLPVQILASALIVGALLYSAEPGEVLAAVRQADMRWVLAGMCIKLVGLFLHEVRLWVTLLAWRRTPFFHVMSIGFLSGLMNALLPIRGGDLIAMGLLQRELDVPAPAAVAAVGITAFIEAAVFGLFLLAVIAFGASDWEELVGAARTAQAQGWLTLAIFGAVFGSVGLVLVSRRLRKGEPEPEKKGVVALVRETVVQAGTGMTAWGPVAGNVVLAFAQVAAVVVAFWTLLPALGLELDFPVLAVCGVIALGSMAAIVLPPSTAAGTAATAVFVLGAFGVSEADALAYTALTWIVASGPPFIVGFIPALRRMGRIGELIRGKP